MDISRFKELIKTLADADGVSGSEGAVADMAADIMRRYTDDVELRGGNVLAHFGKRSADRPHVLIDAHMDKVGLICTDVRDDGFIAADTVGGLDLRIMPAQRVIVH
ncbi:MAG: M42 family peptidase, partial [Oscillospiraceae bacterium]|nr:M42 family peptidase [Oscillospiraceae bacterium]